MAGKRRRVSQAIEPGSARNVHRRLDTTVIEDEDEGDTVTLAQVSAVISKHITPGTDLEGSQRNEHPESNASGLSAEGAGQRSTRQSKPPLLEGLRDEQDLSLAAPFLLRPVIGVLAVENLPQAFDEFSQRQQNINTVALFCTSPPHESEERKIKHAWMKLRGLTLEALIELIEGDTSNTRGKATPSSYLEAVRAVLTYQQLLGRNSEGRLRRELAILVVEYIAFVRILHPGRDLASKLPAFEEWFKSALAIAEPNLEEGRIANLPLVLRQNILQMTGSGAKTGLAAASGLVPGLAEPQEIESSPDFEKAQKLLVRGGLFVDEPPVIVDNPLEKLIKLFDPVAFSNYEPRWARMLKPKNVLLFGPPGTGKTTMVKEIASKLGINMLAIQASDYNNMYVGGSEKFMKAVFAVAKANAPCIIFVDEIDNLIRTRTSKDLKHDTRLTNEFLLQVSELARSNAQAFVIGATSLPWHMDVVALQRFPLRCLITLPTGDQIERILLEVTKDMDHDLVGPNMAAIVEVLKGYTGDEITNIVECVATDLHHAIPSRRYWAKKVVNGREKWMPCFKKNDGAQLIEPSDLIAMRQANFGTITRADLEAKAKIFPKTIDNVMKKQYVDWAALNANKLR